MKGKDSIKKFYQVQALYTSYQKMVITLSYDAVLHKRIKMNVSTVCILKDIQIELTRHISRK